MRNSVKIILIVGFTAISMNASVAQQSLNFVRTFSALKPITSEPDMIAGARTTQEIVRTTEYIDGLGRVVQSVVKQASPLSKDLVNMRVYDNWGREVNRYMPFASSFIQTGDVTDDGNYKVTSAQQQLAFNQNLYPGENNFYYTQTIYENSPSNRPLNSYSQGNSWIGNSRGSTIQYLVNTVSDNVQIWNISLTQGSLPTNGGAYIAGQLYKTIASDENNKQVIEYKDKSGNLILKKVQQTASQDPGTGSPHSGWLCTYFVYDDYNNMRFIITPKVITLIDGTWSISQTLADELCFRNEYDQLNRVIIKKNPGTASGISGEQWIVYDQRGRIVMTQDGNQRGNQKWQYFQYDNLDRLTTTGLLNDPTNYLNLTFHQNNASTASVNPSYPNLAQYSTELLSQTYYDNYSWVSGTGTALGSSLDQTNTSNTAYFYTPSDITYPYPQAIIQTNMTRGMITGGKTEILGSNGSQYLHTVTFYDDKGRVIQTQGTNITGGVDKATSQYSWTGTILRNLEEQNKNTATAQTNKILTKMNYAPFGRLLSVTKTISTTISTTPTATVINGVEKTIATYSYNEAGQLTGKNLGQHPITGNPLETLAFTYNVRGWLTGINKNFTQSSGNSNYFGEEIGYDKTATTNGSTTFLTPAFTGNLSGQLWKTKGDGVPRKYDFTYSSASQLTSAGFLQNTSGSNWDKTYIDYSVNNITYDPNGNIKTLNQNGFVLGGAPNIDDLTYNYTNTENSNKLLNVIDNANVPLSKLGDFHYAGSKTSSSVDYGYDANGNQLSDANKNISSISYNTLNLPSVITVTGKGTVSFTYDAAGNKVKKLVQENNVTIPYPGGSDLANITTTTTYIGGFVYYSKNFTTSSSNTNFINYLATLNVAESLQYISHEEGSARIVYPLYGQTPYYAYDYLIRDHLGNVRVTITDEQQQDTYPAATLETGGINTESSFYNIVNDANHVIPTSSLSWWGNVTGNSYTNGNGVPVPPDPTINPGSTSSKLYKLNGASGDRFGMGIALKVMAGDEINIFGKSVWHNSAGSTTNTGYNITNVLTSFINAFGGTGAVAGGSKGTANGTILNGNSVTTGDLNTLLTNVPTPSGQTPKAYINWILFDEQFKPVQSGSGYDPINVLADVVKPHSISGISIVKSGYLYIYCSNESNQDVYFDNLQVIHKRGPLIEERHYYPDGLAMFGLGSRAYGKLQVNFGYQGKEFQNGEFYDGTGLEEYDFEARYYDPQLGRWTSQDGANQFASPYSAMGNNWSNAVDPTGLWAGWDDVIVAGIGFVVGYVTSGITTGNWGWRSVQQGLITAATFLVGYYTAGGSSISQGNLANIFSTAGAQAQANTVGLAFAARAALSSVVGSLMPGINIPIGNNFTIGISPGLAINGGALIPGMNVSATYADGNWVVSGGLGVSGNSVSYGGGVTYSGFGVSYSQTIFGNATGPDAQSNAQKTGMVGLYGFGASIKIDNDFLGDKEDRWRTGAIEVGIGDFVVGLSVYTNSTSRAEGRMDAPSATYGYNQRAPKYTAWQNGKVYSSPLWVGYRHGNQVSRFGLSHWRVQDIFQNGLHQSRTFKFANSNYFLDYSQFRGGLYSYTGLYNPFTLY